ncbi:MAG TPA: LpqB family beta-propeller domain-containing protein [Actinocrinis sp.]|nr:LpqB family beta-propeller domain-containing protein [Actinocrinis sp.]
MSTRKPSARAAALGLLSLLGVLTAGCVNLPANSGVNAVSKQAEPGGGSDVRIWPQGPQRRELPAAIVEGFLQTAASDPGNLSIAREYLTGDALSWDPQKVIVFSGDESSPTSVPGHDDQVQITGTVLAKVDDDGTYQPVAPQIQPASNVNQSLSGPVAHDRYTFFVKPNDAKGYYQIDKLPSDDFGIVLTEETFRAEYNAYNLYYLNSAAQSESMIPVPVYLRAQSDVAIAQKLADKLLGVPPAWLDGSAVTAAPQIALAGRNAVNIESDGTAQVTVKSPNACTTHSISACNVLADELFASYSDLASVSRVTIVDQHGTQLGQSLGPVDSVLKRYHVGIGGPGNGTYYYLNKDSHAVYANGSRGSQLEQVGPANRRYRNLAVTDYDGQTIAAVVDDSKSKLYLGQPGEAADRQPVFTGQITSLSWDALGHLWFIDASQHPAALYRLDATQGLEARPQRVTYIGTDGDSMAIAQLAVAPDGRRVAVVYSEQSPSTGSPVYSVGIGVLIGSGSNESLDLRQAVQNPVVYQWNSVQDIDWHGSQSLAVLGGQQPSSPSVVSELYTDGSPVTNSTDLNAVTINPPSTTSSIEWTGSTLLAAYGTTKDTPQQITQYSFNSNSWSSQGAVPVQGFSPSYAN